MRRPSVGTWVLVAATVGSSMSFIDANAVNVALPVVQRDLAASVADLQWVIEGYTLFLSALILVGGSLGDRIGRRSIFVLGIAIFTLASLACAMAPTVHVLIGARCIQGVGAALATPESLALISATFSGEARGRAIGTWSGVSAMVTAVGPILGGWLAQAFTWRAVFLINLPLGIIVVIVSLLRVPESRDEHAPKNIDVVGAMLATAGLGALTYGLIRMQVVKGDVSGEIVAVCGVMLLAAFVAYEHWGTREPMVRTDLFRSAAFTGANFYTLLVYAALSGALYFVPFDLINVHGYTPLDAGLVFLPFILIMFAGSRWSGGLAARIGARIPLVAGALVAAIGYVTFALSGTGGSYWATFFPAAVLLGIGGTLFVAPLTTVVMSAARVEEAGVASGINNAVSRAAGLIAVAALGIALAGTFDVRLDKDLMALHVSRTAAATVDRMRDRLLTGRIPPDIVAPQELPRVTYAIRDAYVGGFRKVMLVAAALTAAGAIVAAFWNVRV